MPTPLDSGRTLGRATGAGALPEVPEEENVSGDRAGYVRDAELEGAGMTWIGIDPATKCGWAVIEDDGTRVASGVWKLDRRRGDGAGMTFVRFEQNFRELLATYTPHAVAYDQQVNRYAGAAHIGAGIISHLQRICEELEVPYSGVPFATVKKHATGKGNASKDDMVMAAVCQFGVLDTTTDDEADALWVADAVRGALV